MEPYCRECFYEAFELEVHHTILGQKLFDRNDRVAIAVSGGKDSTVLAHLMTTLNRRYDYGLDLFLLAVDEGITGYRDDSLRTVKRNEAQFEIPLKIVSYEELYGWRMDQIVEKVGTKNNCTFCGVFRRQALDRGAQLMRANKICTGHNIDDCAETALMNILRGDTNRFSRCSDIMTGGDEGSSLPRCKPLMFAYEKEIVLYAHFKKLDYFSTECVYSANAYRGYASGSKLLKHGEMNRSHHFFIFFFLPGREFIKSLEASNPQLLSAILMSVSQLKVKNVSQATAGRCQRCGWMSSNKLCKACVLLDGLSQEDPNIALANKSRQRRNRKAIVIAMENGSER